MRKILSIPLIALMLFSGITVSFAVHYCGGHIAATKVSLSGELAGCGMEHSSVINSSAEAFTKQCCNDVRVAYSLNCTFIPSLCFVNDPTPQVNCMTYLPVDCTVNDHVINLADYNTIKPPGIYAPNSVDRQVICIFRI